MRPSKEELDDLYNKQKLTTYQIADMLGCCQQTISKWLIQEGINRQSNKPTPDELNTMYAVEKMTCRQIAAKTGCSRSAIIKWLKDYGIECRPASIGLAYHGKETPTYEDLYRLVHVERKSYQEIGKIYGIDKSAIPHWMKKYGIPRPTAWDTRHKGTPRCKPSRDELLVLYESGLTLTAIGDLFDFSWSTIWSLCKEYGIEMRPSGWEEGKRYLCQDGHLVRSIYEQRVDNWLFAHNVAHIYEPLLPWAPPRCHFKSDFLANGWYIEVWGVENNENYKRRREQKCQLYQQNNAPLVELPYYFFGSQKRAALERRLSKCLTNPLI